MRKCKVYVHGVEAGILTERNNPTEYLFSYKKDYVDKKLPGVSLTMPPREEEYRSKVLFQYFFNLLTEGENREMQASLHHLDKDDDFGILIATAGCDVVGVVTVKPIE